MASVGDSRARMKSLQTIVQAERPFSPEIGLSRQQANHGSD
jgi:hypothetical protein